MKLEIVEIEGCFAGYNLVLESRRESTALHEIVNNYNPNSDGKLHFAECSRDYSSSTIFSVRFRVEKYLTEQPFAPYPTVVKPINRESPDAKIILEEITKIATTIWKEGPVGIPESIVEFLWKTQGDIGFELMVTEDNIILFRCDDKKRISQLLFLIEEFTSKNIPFFLYEYNIQFIRPKFVNDLKKWASETFEL